MALRAETVFWLLLAGMLHGSCGLADDLTENCKGPAQQELVEDIQAEGLGLVHVLYAADARTFGGLVSSMISLVRHLKTSSECLIHLIVSPSDLGLARRMIQVFRHELADLAAAVPNVTLHTLRPVVVDISKLSIPWFRPELLKQQNFVRYYLHHYLPQARRVLWLDTDTIIQHDVAPLFRMRMEHAIAARPTLRDGHNTLGGKREQFQMLTRQHPRKDWDFPNESLHVPTFSTGVVLYNLDLWRSGALTQALERWTQVLRGIQGTQLVMNVEFISKYDQMDWWWNVEGLGIVKYLLPQECIDGGRILHWSGPHKPWRMRVDHPYWGKWVPHHDYLFERYAIRSSMRCAGSHICRMNWKHLVHATSPDSWAS